MAVLLFLEKRTVATEGERIQERVKVRQNWNSKREDIGNTEFFDVNKKKHHKLTLPHGSRKRYSRLQQTPLISQSMML